MAYTEEELKKELETKEYEYGFYTDIESDTLPNGLNEEIVVAISRKKEEPQWMTDWRLQAYPPGSGLRQAELLFSSPSSWSSALRERCSRSCPGCG